MHRSYIRTTEVTHAGTQTTEQLMNNCQYAAFVRYASLDTFRYQLVVVAFSVLEVTVFGALLHCSQTAHAAVGFVGPPLIQFDFARRFFGTGKQAAQHDSMSAGSDGLRNVAGKTHSAICDERHIGTCQRICHILYG